MNYWSNYFHAHNVEEVSSHYLETCCWKNYVHKNFKPVRGECKFTFAISFLRRNNGWTMAWTLFATFEDIYTVKIENKIIALLEIKFYRRNIDDIWHQQNVQDILSKYQHYPKI